MNSLFRIDRNSIRRDEIESAGVVVIPDFYELADAEKAKEEEKPKAAAQEAPPDEADGKRKELEALQKEIDEAKRQAQQLVAEAEGQADKIRKDAERAGYEDGIRKAQTEFEEESRRQQQEFTNLKKGFAAAKDEMLEDMERSVLDLSLCIAGAVIKETLDRNDEVFLNIVRDTLSRVKEQSDIVLKVSKREYDRFFADGEDEFTSLLKGSGIEVRQDIGVESGECVIDTEYGTIRAGIRTQLKRMAGALYEAEEA